MPLISNSTYTPPPLFRNGHLQTLYPVLFRRVPGIAYTRERISTPDDDFLDLDWARVGADSLVIVLHGLEGSSRRLHVRGMVRALNRRGWDVLALNLRGCSGVPNRRARAYHSGATEDLQTVVAYVPAQAHYRRLALVGFSLGGNLLLKYLGEQGAALPAAIVRAVAISVPCDLTAASHKLAQWQNQIYMRYFLHSLRGKLRQKLDLLQPHVNPADLRRLRSFKDFDDLYTAPFHGFTCAEDYWRRAGCRPFIPGIAIPTLLLNAWDDPFLTGACFPLAEAEQSTCFFLEAPRHGGHVGFVPAAGQGEYWHEQRAGAFLQM
jgi:uncharacterized protein